VTESKRADFQAGVERLGTLLPAVLAGVNLITCAGTLDGSLLEDHAMLMLDDEVCAAAVRLARGIEVTDETLPLDLIKEIGYSGNYLAEEHTAAHFRNELFMPKLYSREPYQTWDEAGRPMALDHAREKVKKVLAEHEPRELDPAVVKEMTIFKDMVAERDLTAFYEYEQPENQDFDNL
jgi:trimethylamine--corrinoid protein Co-methyltransferase